MRREVVEASIDENSIRSLKENRITPHLNMIHLNLLTLVTLVSVILVDIALTNLSILQLHSNRCICTWREIKSIFNDNAKWKYIDSTWLTDYLYIIIDYPFWRVGLYYLYPHSAISDSWYQEILVIIRYSKICMILICLAHSS